MSHTDKAIGLFDRVAACFIERRHPGLTVQLVRTMVAQRVSAMALGYEDIDDHDTTRQDPVLGLLGESLEPKHSDCARLADSQGDTAKITPPQPAPPPASSIRTKRGLRNPGYSLCFEADLRLSQGDGWLLLLRSNPVARTGESFE